jgi:N-dimethylarginine dimethylaminohydrolase
MSGGLHFEGGDVVIDYPNIFVGISAKDSEHGIATDDSFVKDVQRELPDVNIIPIRLANDVLHLDLVFNILPFGKLRGKSCVLYPDGLTDYVILKPILEQLFDKVYLVNIDDSEQYVCNYINTGPNKMVVSNSTEMRRLVKEWKKDSPELKVQYVEYRWIYSYLGGSIRCSTMPVVRTQNNTDQIPSQLTVYNEIDPLRVCLVGKATPDKSTPICAEAYRVVNDALERDKNQRSQLLEAIETGLEQLVKALQKDGVIVLRPDIDTLQKIQACNVIFSRDIACVIGNKMFISDLHLDHRKDEYLAGEVAITTFFTQSTARKSPTGTKTARKSPTGTKTARKSPTGTKTARKSPTTTATIKSPTRRGRRRTTKIPF